MNIKLSDFILENSISEADAYDIVVEQAMAEFAVYSKLMCYYAKQLLMDDEFFEEADVLKISDSSVSNNKESKGSKKSGDSEFKEKEADFFDASLKSTVKLLEAVKVKLVKLNRKNSNSQIKHVIKQLSIADDASMEELLTEMKNKFHERSASKIYGLYNPDVNMAILQQLSAMTDQFLVEVIKFCDYIRAPLTITQYNDRKKYGQEIGSTFVPHTTDEKNRLDPKKNAFGKPKPLSRHEQKYRTNRTEDNIVNMDTTLTGFLRQFTKMDLEHEYDVNSYYESNSVTMDTFRDRLVDYVKFYESPRTKDIIGHIIHNILTLSKRLNKIDMRYNYTQNYWHSDQVSAIKKFFGVGLYNRSTSHKYSNLRRMISDIGATSVSGKRSVFGRLDTLSDKYYIIFDHYMKKKASESRKASELSDKSE